MEHLAAINVPRELLPVVTSIARGELVIFFIHPSADAHTVDVHWKALQSIFGEHVDFQTMAPLSAAVEERRQLREWRGQAMRQQRPVFVQYSGARHYMPAELEADKTFYYYPGYHSVLLQLGKWRGNVIGARGSVMVLEERPYKREFVNDWVDPTPTKDA